MRRRKMLVMFTVVVINMRRRRMVVMFALVVVMMTVNMIKMVWKDMKDGREGVDDEDSAV